MSAGKGDKPRPLSISKKELDKRWDAIDWSKKKKNEKDSWSKASDELYHELKKAGIDPYENI
jgi:hypothetical protein